MTGFTEPERAYLSEPRLGRLATVDDRGQPHVVPTGFQFNSTEGVIDIGGYNMAATKKFRDARTHPQVAYVIDDLASTDPWRPRGIEIQGEAQRLSADGRAWIRISPTKVRSWGLD